MEKKRTNNITRNILLSIVGSTFLASVMVQAKQLNQLPQAVNNTDFYDSGTPPIAIVNLGRNLFFDKILSGNKNISCASCHHPLTGTSDGLSLSIGEGGEGLSVTRTTGRTENKVVARVPRNTPAIFNLGAKEFTILFHDGRVAVDPYHASGYQSPAGNKLPLGLDNVLAVQALFPPTSGIEMAGQIGENPIADQAAVGNIAGHNGVWQLLTQRIRNIPEYVEEFQNAFSDINETSDITIVHIVNAIAAFEAKFGRADNSPFDRYLRGDKTALSLSAIRGMHLFYGRAACSQCHGGKFQTDHAFHAIAMPQVGPGKGDNQSGYTDGADDFGRERISENPKDRFAFRTPSLRNITLTAPYGHAGSFSRLSDVAKHHLNSVKSLYHYSPQELLMPYRTDLVALDLIVMNDPARLNQIAAFSELQEININQKEFADLLAFLYALTDPRSINLRNEFPQRVPSGLPVFD